MSVSYIEEQIFSNQFTDINWSKQIDNSPKRSTGVQLKQYAWFVPGLSVINSQVQMNMSN